MPDGILSSPNPAEVRRTLQFWLDNIDAFNGRPWWPRPVALRATVDASGVGFDDVLASPQSSPVPFQGTFTEAEAGGSSTLREILGYVGAVQMAAQIRPELLAEASISITGDKQGAISCINNLRSPVGPINEALQRLFDVSARLQCDIIGQWVPREMIEEADAQSREPDATDWRLAPELFAQVCKRFEVVLDIDLFGSDIHHRASMFISRVFMSGCTAVDAFRQDWAELVQGETSWVFPPVRAVSRTLSLIEQHAISALVVMPGGSAREYTNEPVERSNSFQTVYNSQSSPQFVG
jgi:hypothetical protein